MGMPGRPSLAIRARLERLVSSSMAREVRERKLTYLSLHSLRNIERCLRQIRRRAVPGITVETGVALGGSALLIASVARDREFHGYDVFGMIPPPGERDGEKPHARYEVIAAGESQGIGGDQYYGYQDDLYEKVCAVFAEHGMPVDQRRISLHRGLFEDTLDLDGKRVAFAHLDCDWYEPVKLCLERVYPVLSPGGFVISDDYHDYDGATQAVDEFLAAHPDMRKVESRRPPDRYANLVLTRV